MKEVSNTAIEEIKHLIDVIYRLYDYDYFVPRLEIAGDRIKLSVEIGDEIIYYEEGAEFLITDALIVSLIITKMVKWLEDTYSDTFGEEIKDLKMEEKAKWTNLEKDS